MPYANDPAPWQDFYVMMGGANAALTGLVFVAISIHLREVLDHPLLKPRAVLALVVLTTQIAISAIVLTPQSRELMGLEILVLNGIFTALYLRQRLGAAITVDRGALISLLIRATYTYAAISLIVGIGGGFYVLALVLVVTLGRTMVNAWTLLTALEPA